MRIESTVGSVERATPPHINERIRRQTECSVIHHAAQPEQIDRRLAQLDEEWTIERALEAQAAGMVLAGLVLSVVRGRKWLGLSAFSGYFLLQHALTGWCPPVSVLRRLGVRTAQEIETERMALKALRRDFAGIDESRDVLMRARAALAAALGSPRLGGRGGSGGKADAGVLEVSEMEEERRGARTAGERGRRATGQRRREEEGGSTGPGSPGFADGV